MKTALYKIAQTVGRAILWALERLVRLIFIFVPLVVLDSILDLGWGDDSTPLVEATVGDLSTALIIPMFIVILIWHTMRDDWRDR